MIKINARSGAIGVLLLYAMLSACVPVTETPTPTPTQPAATPTVIVNEALQQDAKAMATDQGISVDEAIRRISMQDTIGELNAQLTQQEVETFAGLWIQHEPEYAVIAAFTEDGEETIQPYIQGTPLEDVVEVRQFDVSLADLETTQDHLLSVLDILDLSFATGINVKENTVNLYVTDMELWETSLQGTRIQIPANFTVVETYEPLGDELPFDITPVKGVFMPQLKVRSSAFMEALLTGLLVIDDGCLRVMNQTNGDSHLVIWQPDYFLNTNGVEIEVLNREGQVVARVGAGVEMGGGEIPFAPSNDELREPIPDQCAGPYWLMGEIINDR